MLLENVDLSAMKDAEVYMLEETTYEVRADDGKLQDVASGSLAIVAVRVERDKRIGFSFSTVKSLDDINSTMKRVYEIAEKVAKVSQEVPWWKGFPSSKCSRVPGIYSKVLAERGLEAPLGTLEEALAMADANLSVMGYAVLSLRRWAIANTEGTQYEEEETKFEMGLWASRRVNGGLTKSTGDIFTSRTNLPNVKEMATKIYEEAKSLVLRPKRISGVYDIYFDPRATAEILDFLAEAFYANNVARGHSPLVNKLKEKVFNEVVTISDNPSLPGGPESHGCDEEGVPSSPSVLVNAGIVTAYLGDLYWGYKLGFVGRGYRSDPTQPPSPSYTNLALHAGKGAEGDVLVAGLTGLHTASPETGDMSVVLSPAWYKGEHVEAVLTTNVYRLMDEDLLGIGSNGRWVGSIFTPGIAVNAKLS